MGQGAEVYTQAGNLVFSSEWGHARILGEIVATTKDGSFAVSTVDGTKLGTLFAYRTPFIPVLLGFYADETRNEVICKGNVITWKGLDGPLPVKIIYGDAYR